jgi:membrane fusion protein (multidrug efflux system)
MKKLIMLAGLCAMLCATSCKKEHEKEKERKFTVTNPIKKDTLITQNTAYRAKGTGKRISGKDICR